MYYRVSHYVSKCKRNLTRNVLTRLPQYVTIGLSLFVAKKGDVNMNRIAERLRAARGTIPREEVAKAVGVSTLKYNFIANGYETIGDH